MKQIKFGILVASILLISGQQTVFSKNKQYPSGQCDVSAGYGNSESCNRASGMVLALSENRFSEAEGLIVKHHANINYYGYGAGILTGNMRQLEFLKRHRADPNQTMNLGYWSRPDNVDVFRVQFSDFDFGNEFNARFGAAIDIRDPTFQLSPLVVAVLTDNSQALSFLLKLPNILVNAQDALGNTAMHYAIVNARVWAVKALLRHEHLQHDLQNQKGYSAVELAKAVAELESTKQIAEIIHLLEHHKSEAHREDSHATKTKWGASLWDLLQPLW